MNIFVKIFNIKNILWVSFFTICFNNIPKILQLNFISSGYANKLTWYPLFALLMIYLYRRIKCKIIFYDKDAAKVESIFLKFTVIYLFVLALSTFIGLINYPYYREILDGPVEQIEKLPIILTLLSNHGIHISQQVALKCWMIARIIKGILFDFLYTFVFAYVVYGLIHSNWKNNLFIFKRATECALYILIAYSSIELFYFSGNNVAASVLKIITPFFHIVQSDHGWWPPLLWSGQLRSIFPEPSHMGNYAAFVLPLLWTTILNKYENTKTTTIISTIFTFMIFMTKARTAISIFFGMFLIFVVLLLWMRNKEYLKRFLIIVISSIIAFGCATVFIGTMMRNDDNRNTIVSNEVQSYLEDNLISLASANKRSNGARYALVNANFITGYNHPILGVSPGLSTAYIVDNFSETDRNNNEVSMWIEDYNTEGVLRYNLDAMNEYFTRFADTGLIGLVIFLSPFSYALWKLFKRLGKKSGEEQLKVLCIFTALIGVMVAGCNGSLNLMYSTWIILAFAYAVIYESDEGISEALNKSLGTK